MSPRRRNFMVGLVVLIGLGVVIWMVLLFAGRLASIFSAPGVPVRFTADRADGLTDGSAIYYLGVQIGRVTNVQRSSDNKTINIEAQVNAQPPLPGDVYGVIRTQSAFGNAAMISLELSGPPSGTLQPNEELRAEYEGSSLIPKQITELAEQATRQQLVKHLDETIVSVKQQAERAGQVLTSIQQIVSDPKLRQDLRAALSNIRTATESATRVGTNLEKVTGDLQHITTEGNAAMSEVRVAVAKLSQTLARFESVVQKVDQGKGTAGMLVNDPKLYQGLVDTTHELNGTIADLQRLIQQWEQEGVTLKLGK